MDGEKYEGTVVFRNTAHRNFTVRFLGYNNEEEVNERGVNGEMEEHQVERARLDAESEEDEERAGDEFQLGDWYRVRMSPMT